jgi:hypothetical protein
MSLTQRGEWNPSASTRVMRSGEFWLTTYLLIWVFEAALARRPHFYADTNTAEEE